MSNNLVDVMNKRMAEENLSVSELCSELEIDESTLYMWICDPDEITLSSFRKLADRLRFTESDIKQIFC